jgi:RNA polymerase sigma-70 factor (ECF subfamily)
MARDPLTDEELLAKARGGDSTATDQLLSRHELRIYRYGLRMCGNEADARDVLQETLLAAFKGLSAFRGESLVSTWLFQIARSFCIKQRRRRGGEPMHHESVDAPEVRKVLSEQSLTDVRSHAREVSSLIQAAIRTLTPEYREALVLRDIEGMSAEEAAVVVGVEVGALKSRLHRARMALKQQLAAVLDEDAGALACPDLAKELADYANSDIDQEACVLIEEHLKRCPRCAGACDSLRRTVSLCRAMPGEEVPGPVKAAVRQALRLAAASQAQSAFV